MILIPARTRHARAALDHAPAEMGDVEDLTFDEFLSMDPDDPPPPPLIPFLVRNKHMFAALLPRWTKFIKKNPQGFIDAGFVLPSRFVPSSTKADRARMLRIVATMYERLWLQRING